MVYDKIFMDELPWCSRLTSKRSVKERRAESVKQHHTAKWWWQGPRYFGIFSQELWGRKVGRMGGRKVTRYTIEDAHNAKVSIIPEYIQNCYKAEEKFSFVEKLARDLKKHFTKERVAKGPMAIVICQVQIRTIARQYCTSAGSIILKTIQRKIRE